MKISIIGSGHVGLVTGVCFAEKGHDVLCVDNDEGKIRGLNENSMPFYEPGLKEIVSRNVEEKRLRFSTSIADGVRHGKAIFISVWTPPLASGRADLSHLEKVSRETAEHLPVGEYRLIVEKSTVPVKTGERVKGTLKRFAPEGAIYDVASNAEFLREGTAIKDTLEPDRIVFGVDSERARKTLEEIYADFPGKRVICDVKSAEMIKHASNAFLATKISFINAVAQICERAGADVELVAKGMGMDPRIAPQFLKAGVGYGGSCFPKDLSAFVDIGRELGYEFRLLEEVQRINREIKFHFLDVVERELWNLSDKPIAVLGLAFKPNTDDMRLAPSLTVVQELLQKGAKVRAYDPVAVPAARKAMEGFVSDDGENRLAFFENLEEACGDVEAILLLTEWPQITGADWKALASVVSAPVIFDGRNALDRDAMTKLGWTVYAVGRGKVGPEG